MIVASPWEKMRSAPPPDLEDEVLFEIERGQWSKHREPSIAWSLLASRLSMELAQAAAESGLGWAVGRMLFRLPLPGDPCRRPAGAFVSYKRWPKERPLSPTDNAWDVVPNLAIEIVQDQSAAEMLGRIEDYFCAGVELVWVFYLEQRLVYVYAGSTVIRRRSFNDTLDAGSVLPGFSLPLGKLFQEEILPQQ